ncbi:GrpE, mitochondrial [Tetrabaena socialis]|uniref:GrpE protein homolog n=1 Tax=Tetrabaena socialis TaxID=47790 RepID=A0A2J7ZN87_9CHLO|nr:GrpE, mitochondrial [Tetrabaena socialis]|eukprot:PNH01718.1 GrpE, mitochondrial [Tetrabaena socialis]
MSARRIGSALLSAWRLNSAPSLASCTSRLEVPALLRGAALWRPYSSETGGKKSEASAASAEPAGTSDKADAGATDDGAADGPEPGPSAHELIAQLKVKEEHATKLTTQVETLTDSLKRTLADMENLRMRTAREVDVSKKFAIQGFVKALLDVPDNLERAAGVVPPEALQEEGGVTPEKMRNLLSGLLEGVRATESILMKVLKQNGVERYDPAGQPFDPNLHNALFDVPDPSKDNNIIAMVTKKGYKLNDRVIRPAEVGVVRNVSP